MQCSWGKFQGTEHFVRDRESPLYSQMDGSLKKGILKNPIHRMLLNFLQLERKMFLLGYVLVIEVSTVQLFRVINKLVN